MYGQNLDSISEPMEKAYGSIKGFRSRLNNLFSTKERSKTNPTGGYSTEFDTDNAIKDEPLIPTNDLEAIKAGVSNLSQNNTDKLRSVSAVGRKASSLAGSNRLNTVFKSFDKTPHLGKLMEKFPINKFIFGDTRELPLKWFGNSEETKARLANSAGGLCNMFAKDFEDTAIFIASSQFNPEIGSYSYVPGISAVVSGATNASENARRVVTHEYGHYIHSVLNNLFELGDEYSSALTSSLNNMYDVNKKQFFSDLQGIMGSDLDIESDVRASIENYISSGQDSDFAGIIDNITNALEANFENNPDYRVPSVSIYGMTDFEEFFAEHFTAYHLHGEVLKDFSPELYNAMDAVQDFLNRIPPIK